MSFRSDDRGAAIQVGAIILFAFVIIAITAYQASVVPNQNNQVEFDHNQKVQNQLQSFQAVVGSTPTAGGSRTVVVETSTTYPARSIFVNPPDPTGQLQTVGTGNPAVSIEVRNARSSGETGDFWDGTTTHNYSTGALVYEPNYNVYSEAPTTVVEHSLVYNEFREETIVTNAQSIFDGKRITLVALNGSYSEQGGAASVTVRPVSASSNRVAIESAGGPVTIQIVTSIGESRTEAADRWRSILEESGEFDGSDNDPDAYVAAVNPGKEVTLSNGESAYQVEFELETGHTYSLALAKAGIGSKVDASPRARYVTRASPRNVSTTAESVETLTVEVRDEFNNPIAGVPMNATVESGGGSITEADETETGNDGRVGFTYEAPDASTTARVNVSISKAGGDEAYATFNVSVTKTSGGQSGNGAYNVTLVNVSDTNSPQDAVNCPNWPSNRTCVVDGGLVSTVNVTMGTKPTADGATVSWAVNNTSVATVDPKNGETKANGENSTEAELKQNGDVVVYVSSGAGGNRTTLRVTGLGGAGGDTTPPKLDDITVSTTEQGGSGKLSSLNWDYTSSDSGGSGFKNVSLRAEWADDGTVIADFDSSQPSATYPNTSNSNKKNTEIDVIVTVRDNAGNTRTCTATIDSPGGSATLSDFSCTPTQNVLGGFHANVLKHDRREVLERRDGAVLAEADSEERKDFGHVPTVSSIEAFQMEPWSATKRAPSVEVF